jgi:hypothetical protein
MSKSATKLTPKSSMAGGRSANRTRGQLSSGLRSMCIAEHSKSDITHKPSAIFAEAAHGYVRLQQQGKMSFVLVAEPVLGSDLRVKEEAQQVLALVATPVEHFPNLPGFAWTASLPAPERLKMRDELVLGLRLAVEESTPDAEDRWRPYDQAVYEWKATAEVMADPDLTQRLLEDWSEEDEVTLSRP